MKFRALIPYIVVFFVTFAVYSPTLLGVFYYDDNVIFFGHQVNVLAQNPLLVFKGEMHYLPGAPRSIHVFALLLLYKLFGPQPFPYHLFNLLLHSATTVFVYVILRKAVRSIGYEKALIPVLGALVFGLHPIHLENIVFVTLGGTDLFYTFWAALSLILYIRVGESASGWRKYGLLAFSALTYYFALLSKESAAAFIVVYPLAGVLLKRASERPFNIRGIRRPALVSMLWFLPHLLVLGFYKGGFVFGAVSAVGHAASGASGGGKPVVLDGAIKSIGFFAKSLLFPYPHQTFIKEFGSAALLYAFAVLVGVLIVVSVALRKRVLTVAILWFVATALPYAFVPMVESNVAVSAERYIYMPSVGFALLLSIAGVWVSGRPRLYRRALYAFVVLLGVYGVLGVSYFFGAWRTEEDFWLNAARQNPDYVSSYVSLAAIEMNKGNEEKASALLIEGLGKRKGLPAEFAQAAYNLASTALRAGDIQRAESYYMQSLRYSPYEFAYIDLGFLYLNVGNLSRAKWAFEEALGFPQQSARAFYGLAKTLKMQGDGEGARLYAMKAFEKAHDERLKALAMEIINN